MRQVIEYLSNYLCSYLKVGCVSLDPIKCCDNALQLLFLFALDEIDSPWFQKYIGPGLSRSKWQVQTCNLPPL